MWLVGSLKLTLTYSSTPRLQNFGRGEEWAFASQKYWNMSVRTIHLSCFYFKRFILGNNWSEMTDIMHTHTHTPHHTTPQPHTWCVVPPHTMPHRITHIQFRFFYRLLWSTPFTVHVWIWSPPGFSCLLLCYILLVHQLLFWFKF